MTPEPEECPHGMADPTWCSTCIHGPRLVARPDTVASFTARYPGRCAGCDDSINEGDRITRWTDDAYTHERCDR